jgi:glycosyltransferase involved in cell wall biosynthesis
MDQPMVSVWLITYNHEAYIAEAIEGVLRQQTTFAVELIIGEDCSTDGTRAIVQAYQQRYPERITLYLAEQNMGMLGILRPTYTLCRGKYVAMLDGDDYWTDPLKLQRQVDQLEAQPDARFSFHQVSTLAQKTGHLAQAPEPAWGRMPGEVCMEDLLCQGNVVVTLSVLFRHDLGPLPDWFYELPYPDLALYFLLLMHGGTGLYLPANMGVYRVHEGGWFSSMSSQRRYHYGTRFLEEINQYLPPQYQDLMTHELRHHYYESIVLSLKEFRLGTATRNWLRLGTHHSTTATHRPKGWPHGLLLTGLQYTGRMLHRLNESRRAAA